MSSDETMPTGPLALDKLTVDTSIQSRVELSEPTIREYADLLQAGVTFPPVVAFHDGAAYWLADGFHRVEAARRASCTDIMVDVRVGGRRDAILFAAGANGAHGLRRSNADKRRAVEMLLDDPEWAKWSDRRIAAACGVTHPFVASLRRGGNGYQAGQPRGGTLIPAVARVEAAPAEMAELRRRLDAALALPSGADGMRDLKAIAAAARALQVDMGEALVRCDREMGRLMKELQPGDLPRLKAAWNTLDGIEANLAERTRATSACRALYEKILQQEATFGQLAAW
jgi:hypothetical protein